MKVRMKHKISGTRNGVEWPNAGVVVNVPDDEAENLIKHGYGEAVDEKPEPKK